MAQEKQVSFTATNTYSTLNLLSPQTRNVWLVCHGLGYLSRYFLRHFDHLKTTENYIIAPQAPAKYYLDQSFRKVGASWATRENTAMEMTNAFHYLDQIYEAERLGEADHLILLGYSQGVSVISRWVAQRKLRPAQLVIHSGKVPAELTAQDFEHLAGCKISHIYGKKDKLLDQINPDDQKKNLERLFPSSPKTFVFEGGHEMSRKALSWIPEH